MFTYGKISLIQEVPYEVLSEPRSGPAGGAGPRSSGSQRPEEAGCYLGEALGEGAAGCRGGQKAGLEGLQIWILQTGLDNVMSDNK